MTLIEVVRMVARGHGYSEQDVLEDGWLEDIAERIAEDNGEDVSLADAVELAEQFFEEEEYEEEEVCMHD